MYQGSSGFVENAQSAGNESGERIPATRVPVLPDRRPVATGRQDNEPDLVVQLELKRAVRPLDDGRVASSCGVFAVPAHAENRDH